MKMFKFATAAAALLALVAMASCYADSGMLILDDEGPFDASSFPIINGLPPDAPHHDAVVSLHQLTNGGGSIYVQPFCSGTLLTDTVVLTAAHCLNTGNGNQVRTMKANRLAIHIGDDPASNILSNLYFVDENLIHPSYSPFSLFNDIALVRLSSSVVGTTPVSHLPAGLGLTNGDIGSTLNFAGFGEDETGAYGIKLQLDGTLGGLGCSVPGCGDGGNPATQLSYSQPTGGPCYGDSGGPAFTVRGSDTYVSGITSYGDTNCNIYGVSTRVDAFEGFIDDFIGVAPDCSADGVCNGDCAPGDDPDCDIPPDCSADGFCNPECLAGEDPDCSSGTCGNGVCGVGESCDGRYGTTDCSLDCDGKTNGRPSGRYCFVEGTCEGPGCP